MADLVDALFRLALLLALRIDVSGNLLQGLPRGLCIQRLVLCLSKDCWEELWQYASQDQVCIRDCRVALLPAEQSVSGKVLL